MAVSYNPSFHHTAWVDNVDRVQAAGDNGFNVRFQGVEAEFTALSTVVGQIDTELARLGTTPGAASVTMTLTPQLATIGVAWQHNVGLVNKTAGQTSASGMQSVSLPDGAKIQSLRVLGQKDAGNLTVNLRRQALSLAASPELVVTAPCPTGAVDVSVSPANADVAQVRTNQFRYYLTAELDSSTAAATVVIVAFQITYTTA